MPLSPPAQPRGLAGFGRQRRLAGTGNVGAPFGRPLYAFAAISVAFALVILAFLAGRVTTTHEAASDRSAPVAAAPIAQAPATTGTAAPGAAKPRDKILPRTLVALVGAPEVIDTSTLRIEGDLIRLFGVEWARGGQSDDLVRYLRGRAVTCRPRMPATSIAVMLRAGRLRGRAV